MKRNLDIKKYALFCNKYYDIALFIIPPYIWWLYHMGVTLSVRWLVQPSVDMSCHYISVTNFMKQKNYKNDIERRCEYCNHVALVLVFKNELYMCDHCVSLPPHRGYLSLQLVKIWSIFIYISVILYTIVIMNIYLQHDLKMEKVSM